MIASLYSPDRLLQVALTRLVLLDERAPLVVRFMLVFKLFRAFVFAVKQEDGADAAEAALGAPRMATMFVIRLVIAIR